jgi:hypothetical protein
MKPLVLLLLPILVFVQEIRYSFNVTTKNVPVGAQANVMTLPYAQITFCGYRATGDSCTNVATLYSDQVLTQPVKQPIQADSRGRYGFWVKHALYSYAAITSGGTDVGTFPLSLNSPPAPQGLGGTGCRIGNCIVQDPTRNQAITNSSGTSTNVNVMYNTVYVNNYASVQLAIDTTCNGTLPGSVVLPVGTIIVNAPVAIPANCTITGQGGNRSILQASTSLTQPMLTSSSSHIRMSNFSVDCNRSSNSSVFDGIDLDSSDVMIDGVNVSNCANNGLLIYATSSFVTVQNGEIYNNGNAIASSQGTAGIGISGGAVTHVTITNERVHDNNSGIIVTNTGIVGQDIDGINITSSRIYSNANDAILISTSQLTGGNILNVRVKNNELHCNGWPANGTGFPTSCNPGFQQNGPAASQGGVGVDLIQQGISRVVRPIVSGNDIHDNVFEGVSPTTNVNPIVNTSGTTVSWVSGPQFDMGMHLGQAILIRGEAYIVAVVSSATSMTTTATLPTFTNVATNLPAYMGAMIANNTVSNSGNGLVGPCFYNAFSDSNIYTGNIATNCNFEGFENFYSSFTTYTGDKAYSNNLSNAAGRGAGFTNTGGSGISYVDIVTNEVSTSPTQTSGIIIDVKSSKTFIQSNALFATTPVSDASLSSTTILNSAYVIPSAVGVCGISAALSGDSSLHTMCVQPYTLSAGAIGWKFMTTNSDGGLKSPMTFDNQGNTSFLYGFSVMKSESACVFTISGGLINNVTGC